MEPDLISIFLGGCLDKDSYIIRFPLLQDVMWGLKNFWPIVLGCVLRTAMSSYLTFADPITSLELLKLLPHPV